MHPLRTVEVQKALKKAQKERVLKVCPLCVFKRKKDLGHFILVENEFPYDKIALSHKMLILKRHKPELTGTEKKALESIKRKLAPSYDAYVENSPRTKSISDHWHSHLIVYKNNKKQ